MKVLGIFLFLILLVTKSKTKFVEGRIKTLEVKFSFLACIRKVVLNDAFSSRRLGLGFCVEILF